MSCQHEGFWQCMDTLQEKLLLEQMIAEMHRGCRQFNDFYDRVRQG